MNYDLPNGPKPDYAIELPARFAIALLDATRIAIRMLEITAPPGHHGTAMRLGVLVGREQLFGRIDIAQPSIANPVELSEFGGHLHLAEQRAIASQFRKAFSGPVRQALSIARQAFGHPAVYAVFTEPGMVFLPLSNKTPGRRRIACVTSRDASTMEEERACVQLNQASAITFRFLRETLWEIQSREIDEDPTMQEDMLGFRGSSSGGRPRSKGAPVVPPAPAQDVPQGFEAPSDDVPPFDAPPYDEAAYDDSNHDAPPFDAPPFDDRPGGRSMDDEEDLIDGEVVDLADPTDMGPVVPPPDSYDGPPDDMDMAESPF